MHYYILHVGLFNITNNQPVQLHFARHPFPFRANKKSKLNSALDRSWRLQKVDAARISRESAHKGGKVVSPKHRPPLSQEIPLVLVSVSGWVDPSSTEGLEGISQWLIPKAPSGIDPATFQLVEQCLNHRVPPFVECSSRNERRGWRVSDKSVKNVKCQVIHL